MRKTVLGKGLGALFGEDIAPEDSTLVEININQLEPNAAQPRKRFEKEAMEALAQSIQRHGIISPLIVSPNVNQNEFYTIIAGERRWRAARMIGLGSVPCVVRTSDQLEQAELALIENLQREDLNVIEEANGYKSLADKFSLTQEQIAEKMGKSRSHIANISRILMLEREIQEMLIDDDITVGHAKVLLSISDSTYRLQAAQRAASMGLTVRQLENMLKLDAKIKNQSGKQEIEQMLELAALSERISGSVGTKVNIRPGKNNSGKIEIEYYSSDDFDKIVSRLV